MNRLTLSAVIVSVALIGAALLFVSGTERNVPGEEASRSVIEGDRQIIDITAKGGYSPRVVIAKAGMQTLLRFNTNGTFDCSASVVIPRLSYQKFLQPTGVEEVTIPADQAQGTFQGLCSMGMYNFQIKFE